jgi:hypothetical protein
MDHAMAEKIAGLTSRLDDYANSLADGPDRQTLLAKEQRLTDLSLVAIKADLSAGNADYTNAVNGLNHAIATVDSADASLAKVAAVINDVAQTIGLVEDALNAAGYPV